MKTLTTAPCSIFLSVLICVCVAPWHTAGSQERLDPAAATSVITAMEPETLELLKEATVFVHVAWQSYFDTKDAPVRKQASGSGFVVDAQRGLVVTNWHVVDGYQETERGQYPLRRSQLEILLHSGTPHQRAYPGTLVAADPVNDLAVIHIDSDDLRALPLGHSERILETQPIWIAGFPFGSLFSVLQRGPAMSINRGHISSLRHDDRHHLRHIQFDAATNRGNSGGPLMGDDGLVYGITNMALGTSRVNFAVPVAALHTLLATIPDHFDGKSARITVRSNPVPAAVRIGLDTVITTPWTGELPAQWQRMSVATDGYWYASDPRRADHEEEWDLRLTPQSTTNLRIRERVHPEPSQPDQDHGDALWQEDFSDPMVITEWEQETGGSEHARTWYVDDGILHQSADSGMLHAIYAGKSDWRQYAFSADVLIETSDNDGRAGLLVRTNDDGFILVRLHSQRQIIQVAQHVRHPFGWTILAERPLDVATQEWYGMTIQVHGRHLMASVDGTPVIETIIPEGPTGIAGGIGFYAVDTAAQFRDAHVHALIDEPPLIEPELAALHSFWFSEGFQSDHGQWLAQRAGDAVAPWPMVPGAMLQLEERDTPDINLLRRYQLHDFHLQSVFAVANGRAGVVLRGNPEEGIAVLIDRRAQQVQLVHYQQDRISILARTGMEIQDREHRYHLAARVIDHEILLIVDNQYRLQARNLPVLEGHVGMFTDQQGQAMFHTISVSSP